MIEEKNPKTDADCREYFELSKRIMQGLVDSGMSGTEAHDLLHRHMQKTLDVAQVSPEYDLGDIGVEDD